MMEIDDILINLTNYLSGNQKKITSVESCTGGLLAYFLTKLSGSSKWFEYGFITYSNEAKYNIVNVPKSILKRQGAVSKEAVLHMSQGALEKTNADFAISVSGIAGPDTDKFQTPIGKVFFAIADQKLGVTIADSFIFSGDREQIRIQAVKFALQFVLDYICDKY